MLYAINKNILTFACEHNNSIACIGLMNLAMKPGFAVTPLIKYNKLIMYDVKIRIQNPAE